MLPRIELGDFILYDGKPAKVLMTAEGRMIGFRFLVRDNAPICPHCRNDRSPAYGVDMCHLESAPIIQDKTILLRPVQ